MEHIHGRYRSDPGGRTRPRSGHHGETRGAHAGAPASRHFGLRVRLARPTAAATTGRQQIPLRRPVDKYVLRPPDARRTECRCRAAPTAGGDGPELRAHRDVRIQLSRRTSGRPCRARVRPHLFRPLGQRAITRAQRSRRIHVFPDGRDPAGFVQTPHVYTPWFQLVFPTVLAHFKPLQRTTSPG